MSHATHVASVLDGGPSRLELLAEKVHLERTLVELVSSLTRVSSLLRHEVEAEQKDAPELVGADGMRHDIEVRDLESAVQRLVLENASKSASLTELAEECRDKQLALERSQEEADTFKVFLGLGGHGAKAKPSSPVCRDGFYLLFFFFAAHPQHVRVRACIAQNLLEQSLREEHVTGFVLSPQHEALGLSREQTAHDSPGSPLSLGTLAAEPYADLAGASPSPVPVRARALSPTAFLQASGDDQDYREGNGDDESVASSHIELSADADAALAASEALELSRTVEPDDEVGQSLAAAMLRAHGDALGASTTESTCFDLRLANWQKDQRIAELESLLADAQAEVRVLRATLLTK